MIAIIPYKESWAEEFKKIGAILRNALGELAVRIDHIGSTSVPGLAAKDIIDIQLTVQSFESFSAVQTAIESAGYVLQPEIVFDHCPAYHGPSGTYPPDPDWEKRYFRSSTEQRNTHLHVRVIGRPNQRYALLFRDYLRSHLKAANAYAEVKRRLAKYHGCDSDRMVYVEIKDPICDIIMSAAEEWASGSGWQPGPTDV
ncbi:MAG TPA: GrpB family protein [Methylomusa anaerophila]|uniref:Dephospho-CoA kinase/protein folding accessory domain-containing protein n=1 Tax=Methylomusa anaerophila TaxID=1930071 RepID=A0A348AEQ6_9FIRM|nr:GrpB family protein [Methylomusa anaerophila]BBB89554.1 dephospho-CoA kinase/protein folding accessory domain-containing protein [Methylomusa anaerophila]HML90077.1 GrpB family protein [Methylomusa anaerophila]